MQMICYANQLSRSYIMATLVFNELKTVAGEHFFYPAFLMHYELS